LWLNGLQAEREISAKKNYSSELYQGPVKVGSFEIEDTLAQVMLKASNPHRRSNSEVIKPWMNASDITGHSRNLWIIDFGDMSLEDAALFEMPFEYVKNSI